MLYNKYEKAIQAYRDVKDESLVKPIVSQEDLMRGLIERLSPLPKDTLFLGQADDNLPVLLNLFDSAPGPLLVQADSRMGKTDYLKAIATGIAIQHDQHYVQYGVVTDRPNEWADVVKTDHQIGIFPAAERSTDDFILSLSTWAHSNRSDQSVILLWDNLSTVNKLEMEMVDSFRWLLLRGPAKKVWPIVTVDSLAKHGLTDGWDGYFRTKFSGGTKPGEIFMQEGHNNVQIWMPHASK